MKRKHYLIITVAVFCGILFLIPRGGDGRKIETGDIPPDAARASARKPFSLGRIISSIGLDPEEREIERDPHMSRQEKDEQRKWYRVQRDDAAPQFNQAV
ncbi:MAG: hypothetical protein FWG50_06810 [Kiritimatiellaeota bacterium]|nr:hypothetical protein [Kiritimatiellota bacterium]